MKLHLVGGFLGSGKTTAIIRAAKQMLAAGQSVGVVTNDQGKYLVDTAFMRLSAVPTVEVTGGCFCCNYADLDDRLSELVEQIRPDVVFAESVGSCADLLATVVKPFLQIKNNQAAPVSFSVFADARLLARRLRGDPMPFSEDVVYIFDKQIEEAELVVINKTDLLAPEKLAALEALFGVHYPYKKFLPQSSLTDSGISGWVREIRDFSLTPGASLEMDYPRYGRGEAKLAWLDEVIILRGSGLIQVVNELAVRFMAEIKQAGIGVGHIKFLLKAGTGVEKLSFPTVEDDARPGFTMDVGQEVELTVNARVEMPAEALRALFLGCLKDIQVEIRESEISFFHPGQPNPLYRIA